MFYDSSLDQKSKKRSRQLNFVSHGTFIKQGDRMRKQQMLAQLEEKELNRAESMYGPKSDPDNLVKDKPIYVKNSTLLQNQKEVDPIPNIEWWDEFLLPPGADQFPQNIRNQDIYLERITHYVQHPV